LRLVTGLMAAAALAGISACRVNVNEEPNEANQTQEVAAQPVQDQAGQSNPQAVARARELALTYGSEAERAQIRAQARAASQGLRFLVDLSDRELRVLRGDRLVQTHPAAVGSEEWPTPTGSWQFHRVDINPEWIPPNEEWAKDEERKGPGDPENPMGRARLVYRMPNTVHGTDDLNSLGKAVSHGSIRVANEVALNLAEMLLKAGGAWEGPQWYQQMVQNRTTEYQIDMPNQVPIEVQQ
jgi:lipoprotein-anchoring transpeptidase ErfK/SrfK